MNCTKIDTVKKNGKLELESIITARSVVGYWESRTDRLVTHITEVSSKPSESGSFTDFYGSLHPAGKLRNIEYLGGNKWSCREYLHSPTLIYPDDEREMIWRETVIIMLDRNTIKIGNVLYDRR